MTGPTSGQDQMRYVIKKKPSEAQRLRRPIVPVENARTGIMVFLREAMAGRMGSVLLPAYIGWSPTEGSGVFDPVKALDIPFAFYRMTRDLRIDVDDFCAKLASGTVRVVIIIHYFGYPDPALAEVVDFARKHRVFVLEDEAHAVFSDRVGGICGTYGDAAVVSLHKVLPVEAGGLLVLNSSIDAGLATRLQNVGERCEVGIDLCEYDLVGISRCRRRYARWLVEGIRPLFPWIVPLRPILCRGVVPQTLPVLVQEGWRDGLYHQMNSHGFGVVSLYHTLISAIGEDEFPESHWISRRILNLPVHQDADPHAIGEMLHELAREVRTLLGVRA